MNGLNKLSCYIAQGWNVSTGTNALAYWAHLKVMKKIKFLNTAPGTYS
jgi:hypothetical protein